MSMEDQNKIDETLQDLPMELHDQVLIWLSRLQEKNSSDQVQFIKDEKDFAALVKLIACSEFAANTFLQNWDWFATQINLQKFNSPLDQERLNILFSQLDNINITEDLYLKKIRQIRNQCLIHILWRDVVCGCDLNETLSALSKLAEYAIISAAQYASRLIESRYGFIPFEDHKMPINILAMGKLGGSELNFSSDVDLIFLYPENGISNGKDNLPADEYFSKVARKVVSLLNENLDDGFVYRVDTRLRPFGDSGSLVYSYAALENYLLKHGRAWERYAYVKARLVFPDKQTNERNTIINSIIKPFVFRKYLDYGILESLRELKSMIAKEVLRKNLFEDIKLGPGGIREIEFIVQSIQLIRGGNSPLLRQPELKNALDQAVKEHDLDYKIGQQLYLAYCFLRRFENYIQCIRDQQTHKIPHSTLDKTRVALMLGHETWDKVLGEYAEHKAFVSQQFSEIVFRGQSNNSDDSLSNDLKLMIRNNASQDEWNEIFSNHNMHQPSSFTHTLSGFFVFLKQQKIDKITYQRLEQLLPNILSILVLNKKSHVTLERVIIILYEILRRSAYIAFLNENRAALERLIFFCEKSIYLTEMIARSPLLLDEILNPSEDDLEELSGKLSTKITSNAYEGIEKQTERISRFQRNAIFHLAIADLDGNIPIMKVSDKLTRIAEITISNALKLAYQELTIKFGEPEFLINKVRRKASFGVIAYGKLGGFELSYGSDLDLVFLHNSEGEQQVTNAKNSIGNDIFFSRLAQKLIFLLTTQTSTGVLYDIDTRLRPSGKSGLLITSINAFKSYQEKTAWTWEHQALLRSRLVAGDSEIKIAFDQIRQEVLMYSVKQESLRNDVLSMRKKMRLQLDKTDKRYFDLKNGSGGIGDIEFLVQFLVLSYAQDHPQLIFYTDNIRQLDALFLSNFISEKHKIALQEIYKTYRKEMHLLSLDVGSKMVSAKSFNTEINTVTNIWEHYFLEK